MELKNVWVRSKLVNFIKFHFFSCLTHSLFISPHRISLSCSGRIAQNKAVLMWNQAFAQMAHIIQMVVAHYRHCIIFYVTWIRYTTLIRIKIPFIRKDGTFCKLSNTFFSFDIHHICLSVLLISLEGIRRWIRIYCNWNVI